MDPTTLSDKEIYERFSKRRDDDLFDLLVARWQEPAYKLARCLCRGEALAEEVVQETFMRLATGKAPFVNKGPGSFRSWFFSVVTNMARHLKRHERRMVRKQSDENVKKHFENVLAGGDPMRASVDPQREELHGVLEGALSKLEEKWRLPIFLHFVSGMNQNEVAQIIGVSQQMTARRISQGLEKMRRQLAQAGFSLSVVAVGKVLAEGNIYALPASLAGKLVGLASQAAVAAARESLSVAAGAFGLSKTTALATGAVILCSALAGGAWWMTRNPVEPAMPQNVAVTPVAEEDPLVQALLRAQTAKELYALNDAAIKRTTEVLLQPQPSLEHILLWKTLQKQLIINAEEKMLTPLVRFLTARAQEAKNGSLHLPPWNLPHERRVALTDSIRPDKLLDFMQLLQQEDHPRAEFFRAMATSNRVTDGSPARAKFEMLGRNDPGAFEILCKVAEAISSTRAGLFGKMDSAAEQASGMSDPNGVACAELIQLLKVSVGFRFLMESRQTLAWAKELPTATAYGRFVRAELLPLIAAQAAADQRLEDNIAWKKLGAEQQADAQFWRIVVRPNMGSAKEVTFDGVRRSRVFLAEQQRRFEFSVTFGGRSPDPFSGGVGILGHHLAKTPDALNQAGGCAAQNREPDGMFHAKLLWDGNRPKLWVKLWPIGTTEPPYEEKDVTNLRPGSVGIYLCTLEPVAPGRWFDFTLRLCKDDEPLPITP